LRTAFIVALGTGESQTRYLRGSGSRATTIYE